MSMTCSARSFGLPSRDSIRAASRSGSRLRGRVPAIGRVSTRRPCDAHQPLGRGAEERARRATARAPRRGRDSPHAGAGRALRPASLPTARLDASSTVPAAATGSPGTRPRRACSPWRAATALEEGLGSSSDRLDGKRPVHRGAAGGGVRIGGELLELVRAVLLRGRVHAILAARSWTSARGCGARTPASGSGVRGRARCGSISCGQLVAEKQQPSRR